MNGNYFKVPKYLFNWGNISLENWDSTLGTITQLGTICLYFGGTLGLHCSRAGLNKK